MTRNDQPVFIWLGVLALMIVAIVMLGGYTRLSGSGLSIVEWRPISGIIPPLNEASWQFEFAKYQLFPEYRLVNYNMTLAQFKFIFMIEFLHRILGRLIGITFLLPLVYFIKKKMIARADLPRYMLILLMLSAQGFIGWYMVKSGLINDPHVSHYRLSSHLIMAVALYTMVIWQMLGCAPLKDYSSSGSNLLLLKMLLALVFIQTFAGGMVAGLKAGLVYQTFPLMGDSFIPVLSDLNDAVTVQFIHRLLAYGVFMLATIISWRLYAQGFVRLSGLLFGACLLQVVMGLITLLAGVPLSFALLHQFGALLLISAIVIVMRSMLKT
jgi:cytochrome c oxidase assembly protein subunit 15